MPRFLKGCQGRGHILWPLMFSSGSFPQNGTLHARNTFQASNCLLSSWNLDKFGNSKLGTEGIRWVFCFKRFFWWDELQDSNCLKLWFTDDCLWSGFLFKMGPKSRKFPKEQLGLSENFHDYRRKGKILLKWWFKIIFTISNIGLS